MGHSKIFLKIPDSKGSVTAKGYEGWILADSFHHAAELQLHNQVGVMQNRVEDYPNIGAFQLTLSADSSKIDLLNHFYKQTNLSRVDIHICVASKSLMPVIQYALYKVIIGHRAIAMDALSDRPLLAIDLYATRFSERFVPVDSDGNAGTAKTAGFDSETARTL